MLTLDRLSITSQGIYVLVKVILDTHTWRFSAIYANTDLNKHLKLWDELYGLANSIDMDWLVAGDFNEIIQASEKLGGNNISRSKAKYFWNFL